MERQCQPPLPKKKPSPNLICAVHSAPTYFTDRSTMPATIASATKPRHENTLEKDILATGPLRVKSKKRKARKDEDEDLGYVDAKSSRKILKIGQELQNEDTETQSLKAPSHDPFAFESRFPDVQEEKEDFGNYDDEEEWGDEEDEIVEEVVRR